MFFVNVAPRRKDRTADRPQVVEVQIKTKRYLSLPPPPVWTRCKQTGSVAGVRVSDESWSPEATASGTLRLGALSASGPFCALPDAPCPPPNFLMRQLAEWRWPFTITGWPDALIRGNIDKAVRRWFVCKCVFIIPALKALLQLSVATKINSSDVRTCLQQKMLTVLQGITYPKQTQPRIWVEWWK